MLLIWSAVIGTLDWIGRAQVLSGLVAMPQSILWMIPAAIGIPWLSYIALHPKRAEWSEHYSRGVRWGIKPGAKGRVVVAGPYCPNSRHSELLQLRSDSQIREFVEQDTLNVGGDVLSCRNCGGSYSLDSVPSMPLTIDAVRRDVAAEIEAADMATWLAFAVLASAAFAVGLAIGSFG